MTLTAERPGTLESPLEHELDPSLQDELLTHAGKWVAITRTQLVSVADTPDAAYQRALEAGVDEPILYHVPKGGESYFF
jgi:Family of unknown function (DUF5678)